MSNCEEKKIPKDFIFLYISGASKERFCVTIKNFGPKIENMK